MASVVWYFRSMISTFTMFNSLYSQYLARCCTSPVYFHYCVYKVNKIFVREKLAIQFFIRFLYPSSSVHISALLLQLVDSMSSSSHSTPLPFVFFGPLPLTFFPPSHRLIPLLRLATSHCLDFSSHLALGNIFHHHFCTFAIGQFRMQCVERLPRDHHH